MDPLGMIVQALAAGAVAGLKPSAEQAVKDAYASVKSLIKRKFGGVDTAQLEQKPDSPGRQAVLREQLVDSGAAIDGEVLAQVRALIEEIARHDVAAARTVGVDIEGLRAESLRISDVVSSGGGVSVKHSDLKGDVDIRNIRAGDKRPNQ